MPEQNRKARRRLRVLVITTAGSDRQKHIEDLFAHPAMSARFEPPSFSPSVPSRDLNNRFKFLKFANEAGLLPEREWDAIREAQESGKYADKTEDFFHCLKHLPVDKNRKGSKADLRWHYSAEFWFKAKTMNRGRSVMGCTLAHLIALKRFTAEDFDVMLEDNVRAPVESCADLIWDAIEASEEHHSERKSDDRGGVGEEAVPCHFRFFGWLGSRTNLEYLLHTHSKKRAIFASADDSIGEGLVRMRAGVFPFPLFKHVDLDFPPESAKSNESNTDCNAISVVDTLIINQEEDGDAEEDKSSDKRHTRPGGNFIWGAYAYWISKTAYMRLLETLRQDVGAMLWRGKRARYYSVKPIDKILPRQIMSLCGGSQAVQVLTHPAFFRAPMLTSKIHVKWDPEFCKSTDYQLQNTGLEWSDLWLTKKENQVVKNWLENGVWETLPCPAK